MRTTPGERGAGERRGSGRDGRAPRERSEPSDRPSAPGPSAMHGASAGARRPPATTRPERPGVRACRRTGVRRPRAVAVALCAALVCAAPAAAQQLQTVRLTLGSARAVDSVRRLGVDVVEWRRASADSGAAVVALAVVAPRDLALLAARGVRAEPVPRAPLPAAMEARRAALGPAAFTVFRDYDDPARGVAAYLRAFAAGRADVAVDSIGATWEGRPILAVKVGPAGDDPSRPNVVFVATYHAREWAATEMALRLVRFLADSLPARPGGAALLASRDVWVVPVANPDGYEYTFTTDRLWRKNRRANGDGSYGVDLNRNHAGFWGFDNAGSSPIPNSETYRGPSAESEPETRAIATFLRAHPPAVALSYHTYADAILYPWAHASGLFAGDQAAFAALAGTPLAPAALDSQPGASKTRYTPAPGWALYPTNGDLDEWAYHALGTLAFTVEMTAGCCAGGAYYGFEFPDDETMLERAFRDNLPFALAVIAAAGGASPGLALADSSWVTLWPRAVVSAPAGAGALVLDFASAPGAARSAALTSDSLSAGRFGRRATSADPALAGVAAARVSRLGLDEQVVARDGAEWDGSPWTGFFLYTDGVEGARCWYTPGGAPAPADLTSPDFAVAGKEGLRLAFWTRHEGSLFDSTAVGHVEVSTDHGASWTEVWRVVGQSAAWYPVSVPLTAAEGAPTVRVRFHADNLPWWVDAVLLSASGAPILDAPAAQGNPLTVNANPVRAAPLVVRWPAGSGNATAQVFSYYGTVVAEETLAGDPGLWRWDLVPKGGGTLANGAYIVVITRGDGVRYRRRVFVQRGR